MISRPLVPLRLLLLSTVVVGCAAPAFAQEVVNTARPPAAAHRQIDPDALLRLMVAKGLVSAADADSLEVQAAVAPPAPAQAATVNGGVSGDIQTVPYIPDTVRRQIKEELKAEVTKQAKDEGWAAPNQVAEWTNRITLFGDIRVREEGIFFDKGNAPDINNYNAINTGAPFNINKDVPNFVGPPFLNTTQDRNRARIRARFGFDAQLDDWIKTDIRVGTGNDNQPVSTNQTLGGGNGEDSKYAIWLDLANIQLTPITGLRIDLGRAENPFWSTDLLFDTDLNFDGVSGRYRHGVTNGLTAFGTIGAFPIYNTDLNFGSRIIGPTSGGAFASKDKWLLAGQIGAEWVASPKVKVTGAVGYFDFTNIEGRVSDPCAFNQDVCDTDGTRPQFQQYGNSVFPIRNIADDPGDPKHLDPENQYFGLVSKFQVLDVHGAVDLNLGSPVGVRLEGDFVNNLAFDRSRVLALQANVVPGANTFYNPGGTGWYGNLVVGSPNLNHRGDWNVSIGYKYLDTDAVLDGLTDADFHLGGTNAKGFIIGGAYGIGKGTSIGLRYLSADQVTGQPYSNDVVQFDLNAKF